MPFQLQEASHTALSTVTPYLPLYLLGKIAGLGVQPVQTSVEKAVSVDMDLLLIKV